MSKNKVLELNPEFYANDKKVKIDMNNRDGGAWGHKEDEDSQNGKRKLTKDKVMDIKKTKPISQIQNMLIHSL